MKVAWQRTIIIIIMLYTALMISRWGCATFINCGFSLAQNSSSWLKGFSFTPRFNLDSRHYHENSRTSPRGSPSLGHFLVAFPGHQSKKQNSHLWIWVITSDVAKRENKTPPKTTRRSHHLCTDLHHFFTITS